jgi:RND family efflux transporter MFP subunit
MMRKRLRFFVVLAVAPTAAMLLLAGCRSSKHKDQSTSAPPSVAVATVQRGNISHMLSVAGQFQPYQVVEVHAKVSGYIRHIYVDIGDRVHTGETLATLEVPELNAQYRGTQSEELRSKDQIEQAQQEVSRAQAEHAALQANYDRLNAASLAQPGLIAAQELDNARSQADASEARIDAVKASLAAAQENEETASADKQRVGALQSYTNVTSPLNGVVLWRYADTGALIQAGTNSDIQSLPVVKVSQSDLLRLRVPVPEDAIKYIHVGDQMQIRVDALDRDITGKVVRFTRDVSLATRTMETEVDVPNADLSITTGMYANTYLRLAHQENVLTVPLGAVQGDGTNATVTVLDAANRMHARKVQIGLRGSLLAEVTGGLNEGDRVVLGDASAYRQGEQVSPRPQAEPTNDVMREEGGMIDPSNEQPADSDASTGSAQ